MSEQLKISLLNVEELHQYNGETAFIRVVMGGKQCQSASGVISGGVLSMPCTAHFDGEALNNHVQIQVVRDSNTRHIDASTDILDTLIFNDWRTLLGSNEKLFVQLTFANKSTSMTRFRLLTTADKLKDFDKIEIKLHRILYPNGSTLQHARDLRLLANYGSNGKLFDRMTFNTAPEGFELAYKNTKATFPLDINSTVITLNAVDGETETAPRVAKTYINLIDVLYAKKHRAKNVRRQRGFIPLVDDNGAMVGTIELTIFLYASQLPVEYVVKMNKLNTVIDQIGSWLEQNSVHDDVLITPRTKDSWTKMYQIADKTHTDLDTLIKRAKSKHQKAMTCDDAAECVVLQNECLGDLATTERHLAKYGHVIYDMYKQLAITGATKSAALSAKTRAEAKQAEAVLMKNSADELELQKLQRLMVEAENFERGSRAEREAVEDIYKAFCENPNGPSFDIDELFAMNDHITEIVKNVAVLNTMRKDAMGMNNAVYSNTARQMESHYNKANNAYAQLDKSDKSGGILGMCKGIMCDGN